MAQYTHSNGTSVDISADQIREYVAAILADTSISDSEKDNAIKEGADTYGVPITDVVNAIAETYAPEAQTKEEVIDVAEEFFGGLYEEDAFDSIEVPYVVKNKQNQEEFQAKVDSLDLSAVDISSLDLKDPTGLSNPDGTTSVTSITDAVGLAEDQTNTGLISSALEDLNVVTAGSGNSASGADTHQIGTSGFNFEDDTQVTKSTEPEGLSLLSSHTWSGSDNWLGSTTYSGDWYINGGFDPSSGWEIDWGIGVNANTSFGEQLTLPTQRPQSFTANVNENVWESDEDYADFWKDVDLETGEYKGTDARWESEEFQEFWGDVDLEYGMYTGHDLKWLAGNSADGGYSWNQVVEYVQWSQDKGASPTDILTGLETSIDGVSETEGELPAHSIVAALYGLPENDKASVDAFMTSNAKFWGNYDKGKGTFSKLGTDLYGTPLITFNYDINATADVFGNKYTYTNPDGSLFSGLLPKDGRVIYKGNIQYLPNTTVNTTAWATYSNGVYVPAGTVTGTSLDPNYLSTYLSFTTGEKVALLKGGSVEPWHENISQFVANSSAGLGGQRYGYDGMTLSLGEYISAQQDVGYSTDQIVATLGRSGVSTQAVGEYYGIETSEVSNFLTGNAEFWGRYDKETNTLDYSGDSEGYAPNLGGLNENYELTGGLVTNFDGQPFSGILPNGQVVSNGLFKNLDSTFSPLLEYPPDLSADLASNIVGGFSLVLNDGKINPSVLNSEGYLNEAGQRLVSDTIDSLQKSGDWTTETLLEAATEIGFTNDILADMYHIKSSELENFLTENATFWNSYDSATGELKYDSVEVSKYLPPLTGLDPETGNAIDGELVRYSHVDEGFEEEKPFTGVLPSGDVYNKGVWVAKENNLIPSNALTNFITNKVYGVNVLASLVEVGYDLVYTNADLTLGNVGEITEASNLIKNFVNSATVTEPLADLAVRASLGASMGEVVQTFLFQGMDGVIDTASGWMDEVSGNSIIETLSTLATQVTGLPVDAALSSIVGYLQSDTHTTNPFSSPVTAFGFEAVTAIENGWATKEDIESALGISLGNDPSKWSVDGEDFGLMNESGDGMSLAFLDLLVSPAEASTGNEMSFAKGEATGGYVSTTDGRLVEYTDASGYPQIGIVVNAYTSGSDPELYRLDGDGTIMESVDPHVTMGRSEDGSDYYVIHIGDLTQQRDGVSNINGLTDRVLITGIEGYTSLTYNHSNPFVAFSESLISGSTQDKKDYINHHVQKGTLDSLYAGILASEMTATQLSELGLKDSAGTEFEAVQIQEWLDLKAGESPDPDIDIPDPDIDIPDPDIDIPDPDIDIPDPDIDIPDPDIDIPDPDIDIPDPDIDIPDPDIDIPDPDIDIPDQTFDFSQYMGQINARFDGIDTRLGGIDTRIGGISNGGGGTTTITTPAPDLSGVLGGISALDSRLTGLTGGTTYGDGGFNIYGFDARGYDRDGYDKDGKYDPDKKTTVEDFADVSDIDIGASLPTINTGEDQSIDDSLFYNRGTGIHDDKYWVGGSNIANIANTPTYNPSIQGFNFEEDAPKLIGNVTSPRYSADPYATLDTNTDAFDVGITSRYNPTVSSATPTAPSNFITTANANNNAKRYTIDATKAATAGLEAEQRNGQFNFDEAI